MDEIKLHLTTPLERTVPSGNGTAAAPAAIMPRTHTHSPRTPELIAALLRALREKGILYCHWKSNWKIDRWLMGDGDLDLLVSRSDVAKFIAVISQLGFKRGLLPPRRELPGVLNYYGYDVHSQMLIHIHAHSQLVLGHDATKNYRIPIERQIIETAVHNGPIPVTSPEIELALFVIRMTLKYSLAEETARGLSRRSNLLHKAAIRDEIEYLQRKVDPVRFYDVLRRVFPTVDRILFDDCLNSLISNASPGESIRVKRRLEKCLTSLSRASRIREGIRRLRYHSSAVANKFVLKTTVRKRLESGGCLIAIVGGDGSGKSTCVKELNKWLGKKFESKSTHMGDPPMSTASLMVGSALRLRRWILKNTPFVRSRATVRDYDTFNPDPNVLQCVRWLCMARDRYRHYKKLRRFASNGGVVICDRFPVEKLRLMDGPRIRRSLNGTADSAVGQFLMNREESYYRQIMPPDLLVVLRADPDVAASRKTTEPESHVRPRAKELWDVDWNGTSAHLINADRPLPDVLADVRALVWAEL